MATKKKWSAKVDTDSTHPKEGLFKRSSLAIAKALASKKVSLKSPSSDMRMLNFYINRSGKNLSQERQDKLQKAKTFLSDIITQQKDDQSKNPSLRKHQKDRNESRKEDQR